MIFFYITLLCIINIFFLFDIEKKIFKDNRIFNFNYFETSYFKIIKKIFLHNTNICLLILLFSTTYTVDNHIVLLSIIFGLFLGLATSYPIIFFYFKSNKQTKKSKLEAVYKKQNIPLVGIIINASRKETEKKINYFIKKNNDTLLIAKLQNNLRNHYNVRIETNKLTNYAKENKIQLVAFLYFIASIGGNISVIENEIITDIANDFKIQNFTFEKLKTKYIIDIKNNTLEKSYKILGLKKNCTNQELKQRFRLLAKKHHPDKVANLGEPYMENAKNKFQEIQTAYQIVLEELKFEF